MEKFGFIVGYAVHLGKETLAISYVIKYNKLIYFTYLTRFALCI